MNVVHNEPINTINGNYPRINGEILSVIPKDVYIPSNALAVTVDCFEGPLDLLLYLIRRQNIDILDIPIAEISRQYMDYINLMQALQLELAADYLAMAAWLAEIKSQLLLPKPEMIETEEADPRIDLVRHLQVYEQYQTAAMTFGLMPQLGREFFLAQAQAPETGFEALQFNISVNDLVKAFTKAQSNLQLREKYQIQGESLNMSERITQVIRVLDSKRFIIFHHLIIPREGRIGVALTLNVILELERQSYVLTKQANPFAEIEVRYCGGWKTDG